MTLKGLKRLGHFFSFFFFNHKFRSVDESGHLIIVFLCLGSVGATNMNEHSSRSHAIFTITIECSEKGVDGNQHVRMGKLHLVDLAVRICYCTFLSKKNNLLEIVIVLILLIGVINIYVATTH